MKYLSFKYLNIYLAVEMKGLLFYDSVCVLRSASQFGFQFSGWRLRLCGLPEECVPRRTEPAVLELRGQGNSRLSCQKKHKQIGVHESSCFSRPDNFSDAEMFGDVCSFSFFHLSLGNIT